MATSTAGVGRSRKIDIPVFDVHWINRGGGGRCGCKSIQQVVRGLDAALLERVVDVVGSPHSEWYVDWLSQCWSMSWSKLVLAAWSRRVERVW